jgi:hypothetical protein
MMSNIVLRARDLFNKLTWIAPEDRDPLEVAEFRYLIDEIIPQPDKAVSACGIAVLPHRCHGENPASQGADLHP